ncbi:hypothetical protein C8F01DRAFT_1003003, partial [Mycena amicta]
TKNARAPNHDPGISNAARFGVQVSEWWLVINPSWRIVGKKLWQGDSDGDWSSLDVPEKNGLYNVLICLKWWFEAARAAPGADWRELVEDVTWAIERMTK